MQTNNLIDLTPEILSINFGENTETAQSVRSFLGFLLKFNYSSDCNTFTLKRDNNLPDIFTQILHFFDTKNIQYSLSESSSDYLNSIKVEQRSFEKRLTHAKEIKNSNYGEKSIPGFSRSLKHYQLKGLNHLITLQNGANFSVPGSGKTTVSYAYYKYLIDNSVIEKLLVIGPRSSFVPWEEEYELCFEKRANLKRISGNIEQRKRIYYSAESFDIFLVTYQTAANDIEELISLCKKYKCLVILDESHYIKRLSNGFWSNQILKLAPYAERKIILTGTPAPNTYEDLWNQINFLWPEKSILGNTGYFKNKNDNPEFLESIKDIIYPLFIRTTKKELDLPQPIFEKIEIELAPLQKRIYDALAIKYISELKEPPLDTVKLRTWRKAKMIRLIQAATNPALLGKYSAEFKLPPLDNRSVSLTNLIERYPDFELPPKFITVMDEIKKSIKIDEKIIIWTNFIQNIKTLSKMLTSENILYARIYGEVPKDFSDDEEDNREKEISRFKTDKNVFVLLANPAACSESISLHRACSNAIYFDRSFNCGQYIQSLDRIHRLGLAIDKKVIYKLFITKDTIDEVIDQRLLEKSKNMENLLTDSISVGSFDTNPTDISGNENEEEQDFSATIQNLLNKYDSEQ